MDQLTIIAVLASAILFSWIGYLLGIYFPVIKRDPEVKREIPKVDLQSAKNFFLKAVDYLRGSDGAEQEAEAQDRPVASSPDLELPAAVLPKLKESTHLWYERQAQKFFAEMDGDVVDLDDKLTAEQHSHLSFLLVDLQDKVGVSARLQAIIDAREEQAFPEEEGLPARGFNPVRSFINYVKSDVPPLEDKPDSIPSQINAILQEMIKDTDLVERGISVGLWPDRGVVFIVGVDVYDEIHQIPDPEIRLVIRKAVKEWEEREEEE